MAPSGGLGGHSRAGRNGENIQMPDQFLQVCGYGAMETEGNLLEEFEDGNDAIEFFASSSVSYCSRAVLKVLELLNALVKDPNEEIVAGEWRAVWWW